MQLLHHRFKVFPITQPLFPIENRVWPDPNSFPWENFGRQFFILWDLIRVPGVPISERAPRNIFGWAIMAWLWILQKNSLKICPFQLCLYVLIASPRLCGLWLVWVFCSGLRWLLGRHCRRLLTLDNAYTSCRYAGCFHSLKHFSSQFQGHISRSFFRWPNFYGKSHRIRGNLFLARFGKMAVIGQGDFLPPDCSWWLLGRRMGCQNS